MGAGCASSSCSCPPASSTALTDQLRPSRHGLSSRAGWLQEIISNPTYYDCEPRNVLDLRHLAEWCWPTLADDSTRPTHNSGFMTVLAKDFLELRYAVPSMDDEGYQMRQLQGAKLDGASPSSSPLSRSRSRSKHKLLTDPHRFMLTLESPRRLQSSSTKLGSPTAPARKSAARCPSASTSRSRAAQSPSRLQCASGSSSGSSTRCKGGRGGARTTCSG